jgi:guanidinopropionase
MEEEYSSMLAPRFAGIPTFMRTPYTRDASQLDIALIGVPYDGATENRPGARHGPREIRNASSMMRSIHHVSKINPYSLCRIGDVGDVPMGSMFDVEAAHRDITIFYQKITDAGALPLSAGGDHSITLPILRAMAADRPVGLIQIDAHLDTFDEEMGSKFSHGTPFRRAVEEGLLDPKRVVQIGIRGAVNDEAAWDYSAQSGMRVIFIEEFAELGVEGVAAEVRRIVGKAPVYLSFDIDGLDPAYAPGTGTPEIGGMTSLEAQMLLRRFRGLNLIGADVVEVSPPFDKAGQTALVGATLMYEILCLMAEGLTSGKK